MGGQACPFELDCGVSDVEIARGFLFYSGQELLAFIKVHVGDSGVETKGMVIAAERPDMHVVHFLNPCNRQDGPGHFFDADFARTAFKENVGRLAQDADAGPQNQKANGQAEQRVDPVETGEMNEDGASNDGDVGKSVAEIVDQDAAHVEIAARFDQGQGNAAVDSQGGDGGPDHPAFNDRNRRAEALDGFIAEPGGKQYQHKRIGVGGQGTSAVIAKRFFFVRGALGPAHGQVGKPDSRHVRKIVHGVIQQSDGMTKDASEDFCNHETERGGHGPSQDRWRKSRMLVTGVLVAVRVAVEVGVSRTVTVLVFLNTSDWWAMGFASHEAIVRADRGQRSPGLTPFNTLAL